MGFCKNAFRYLIAFAALIMPVASYAIGSDFSDFTNATNTFLLGAGSMINIFAVAIATLFAALIGVLMDTGAVLDTGMGETLHLVWVLIRNLVNVFFVFVLLGVAVMMVMQFGGEDSGVAFLKKNLAKIMMVMVAINFTFFGARLALTVNDVFTAAMLSVPQIVWQGDMRPPPCPQSVTTSKGKDFDSGECIKEIYDVMTGKDDRFKDTYEKKSGVNEIKELISELHKDASGTLTGFLDRNNFALVMLTNMLDINKILEFNAHLNSTGGMLVSLAGSVIMSVLTALVFVALLLALLIRMVILWVCIALSPAIVFGLMLKDVPLVNSVSGLAEKASDYFFKNAFLPLLISAPLALSMVMIFSGNAVTRIGSSTTLNSVLAGDLANILWWAASIALLWMGSKAALAQGGDVTASFTGKIFDGVNAMAGNAVGALQHVPIIPMGGDTKMSIGGIRDIPSKVKGRLSQAAADRSRKAADSILGAFGHEAAAPTTDAVNTNLHQIKQNDDARQGKNEVIQELTKSVRQGAPTSTIIKSATIAHLNEVHGFKISNPKDMDIETFTKRLEKESGDFDGIKESLEGLRLSVEQSKKEADKKQENNTEAATFDHTTAIDKISAYNKENDGDAIAFIRTQLGGEKMSENLAKLEAGERKNIAKAARDALELKGLETATVNEFIKEIHKN